MFNESSFATYPGPPPALSAASAGSAGLQDTEHGTLNPELNSAVAEFNAWYGSTFDPCGAWMSGALPVMVQMAAARGRTDIAERLEKILKSSNAETVK